MGFREPAGLEHIPVLASDKCGCDDRGPDVFPVKQRVAESVVLSTFCRVALVIALTKSNMHLLANSLQAVTVVYAIIGVLYVASIKGCACVQGVQRCAGC